jgi:hypothetical protein
MRYPTRPKGAKRDVAKFGQSFRSFSKHRNGANIEHFLSRMQAPAKDFYGFFRSNAGTVRNGQEAVDMELANVYTSIVQTPHT